MTVITLHWLIAVLLLGQYAFGLLLGDIRPGTPERGLYVNLHKSTGLLIGLIIVVRVVRRLIDTPPPLPLSMAPWQRCAAKVGHLALYLGMFMLPLSGYLASNFSKHGIKLFNVVRLAPWGPDDKTLYAFFNHAHHVIALLLAIFVGLHLVAVAKHILIDRDGLMSRMWPQRSAGAATGTTNSSNKHDENDSPVAHS